MKYDFYDDISMNSNFVPYNDSLENIKDNNKDINFDSMSFNVKSNAYSNMNYNNFDNNGFSNNNFMNNGLNSKMTDDIDFKNILKINNLDNNNFNMTNNNTLDLYSPYEGYMYGNAFRDQYVPYKNYQPQRINISSEKEEMLINIGQYSFMAHEMNLYLDIHPDSKEALKKFQEYRDKANELMKIYERKYGSLTISGEMDNKTPFNWVTTKWPWVV